MEGAVLPPTPHEGATSARKAARPVTTCDYNGWNDAPEDEREWFDQHPEIWRGPGKPRTSGATLPEPKAPGHGQPGR